MLGCVVRIGSNHAFVVKAHHQILGAGLTEQVEMIVPVSPCFPAVVKAYSPWRAEQGANVALGGFADLNLSHKRRGKIMADRGATQEGH